MKSNSSTDRLIAAMLLIFVLGFLCVSAQSTSHEQFKHSHHSEDKHHLGDGQQDAAHHEDGAVGAALDTTEHSHPHDPLDHTHDIPLRMTLAVGVEPTFFRDWQRRSPLAFHSAFFIALERPPKAQPLAWPS